jgi:hypothetical protein
VPLSVQHKRTEIHARYYGQTEYSQGFDEISDSREIVNESD